MLYAVLHQEEEEGKKERKNYKRGLFPVKRMACGLLGRGPEEAHEDRGAGL